MSRPKGSTYDPAAIKWAVAEVAKGRSYRDVAEELAELKVKASHQTVKRWCAEAAQPKEPTPLAKRVAAQRERAAEAPAEPAVDEPFDFEAMLKTMVREAQAEARRHDLASNPKGAQSAMKRASDLMGRLAQIEKQKPVDPDVMTYTRTDIAQAIDRIGSVVSTLLKHDVRCCQCHRELSAKWGQGG